MSSIYPKITCKINRAANYLPAIGWVHLVYWDLYKNWQAHLTLQGVNLSNFLRYIFNYMSCSVESPTTAQGQQLDAWKAKGGNLYWYLHCVEHCVCLQWMCYWKFNWTLFLSRSNAMWRGGVLQIKNIHFILPWIAAQPPPEKILCLSCPSDLQ